jgi:peptide deformylase
MSLLQVHTFPDPILSEKAKPVTVFDAELAQLSVDMIDTMYDNKGIGLAANQVAVLRRIIVMDAHQKDEDIDNDEDGEGEVQEKVRNPTCYVNPVIVDSWGETITEEGCLSVLEFTAEVKRADGILLQWQDLKGKKHEAEFEDIEAVCVQHEIDHLNEILFIDHLSPLKRKMARKKLTKMARRYA